jgi:hypothetical protein
MATRLHHPRSLAKDPHPIRAAVEVLQELAHEQHAIEAARSEGKCSRLRAQPLHCKSLALRGALAIAQHGVDDVHGDHGVAPPRRTEGLPPGTAAEVKLSRIAPEAKLDELLLHRLKTRLVTHLCVGSNLPRVVVAAMHQG